jgi:succinate dehydrogenase / fumarate reductase cytochrome b subunit
MMSSQSSFVNRRLHSLLGVIPVGFFLLEHLYTNYLASKGAEHFLDQVMWLWNIPFLLIIEIFFIILPLLYHGIYGVYIALQAKSNPGQFSTFRNWMFILQRITGVITLVFVLWHVWDTRISVVGFGGDHSLELAKEMTVAQAETFQDPILFWVMVIGTIAAVFHLCNGMWAFLVSWGITVGPRAQRVSTFVWMAVFVIVSIIGVQAALAFADADLINEVNKIEALQ